MTCWTEARDLLLRTFTLVLVIGHRQGKADFCNKPAIQLRTLCRRVRHQVPIRIPQPVTVDAHAALHARRSSRTSLHGPSRAPRRAAVHRDKYAPRHPFCMTRVRDTRARNVCTQDRAQILSMTETAKSKATLMQWHLLGDTPFSIHSKRSLS